jgi:hypothetical protein
LRALSAQGRDSRLCGPLLILLGSRLRRTRNRFIALAARVRDGLLPAVAPAVRRTGSPRSAASAPPAAVLPRQFGWVQRMVPQPWLVNHWRNLLEGMLEDPELVAVIAVAPQMGRELRPLCRMLAITPPPLLALPARPRRPRPARKPGERKPKELTPEQVDAKVARMSRLAFANLIHPETEDMGWRPPNRIGYARPRPWPKRD